MNGIIIGGKNSPYGDHDRQPTPTRTSRRASAWPGIRSATARPRSAPATASITIPACSAPTNRTSSPTRRIVSSVTYSNATFTNIGSGTQDVSGCPRLVLHATQIPAQHPVHAAVELQHPAAASPRTRFSKSATSAPRAPTCSASSISTRRLPASLSPPVCTPPPRPRHHDLHHRRRPAHQRRPAVSWLQRHQHAGNGLRFQLPFAAGQLAQELRAARASSTLSYTWSKNLTDNGSDRSNAPQNSYNWHEGEYGPYGGDRTQVLTLNYVYTLPFFKNSHGILGQAFGGWQLSGIASFYTGAPFTVTTSSVDPAGLGLLGSSSASSRPDMICDPNANAPKAFAGIPQRRQYLLQHRLLRGRCRRAPSVPAMPAAARFADPDSPTWTPA